MNVNDTHFPPPFPAAILVQSSSFREEVPTARASRQATPASTFSCCPSTAPRTSSGRGCVWPLRMLRGSGYNDTSDRAHRLSTCLIGAVLITSCTGGYFDGRVLILQDRGFVCFCYIAALCLSPPYCGKILYLASPPPPRRSPAGLPLPHVLDVGHLLELDHVPLNEVDHLGHPVPIPLGSPHGIAVRKLVGPAQLRRHQTVLEGVDPHSVGVMRGL